MNYVFYSCQLLTKHTCLNFLTIGSGSQVGIEKVLFHVEKSQLHYCLLQYEHSMSTFSSKLLMYPHIHLKIPFTLKMLKNFIRIILLLSAITSACRAEYGLCLNNDLFTKLDRK